jgi:hypothetical protein
VPDSGSQTASLSAAGEVAGCRAGGISTGWRVPCRSATVPGQRGIREAGRAASVLRRVPVDWRRQRAQLDDVGVHAFQCVAERSRQAVR